MARPTGAAERRRARAARDRPAGRCPAGVRVARQDMRPHLLGIDEGPFVKGQAEPVPLVAAVCEGADLLESVALSAFPVDGDRATEFLARWLRGPRVPPRLHG